MKFERLFHHHLRRCCKFTFYQRFYVGFIIDFVQSSFCNSQLKETPKIVHTTTINLIITSCVMSSDVTKSSIPNIAQTVSTLALSHKSNLQSLRSLPTNFDSIIITHRGATDISTKRAFMNINLSNLDRALHVVCIRRYADNIKLKNKNKRKHFVTYAIESFLTLLCASRKLYIQYIHGFDRTIDNAFCYQIFEPES